jgi:Na+/proline symporter
MPHFMVTKIPAGLVGIIVAAILSAAMSTISSGMNSSATVFAIDIYKRYFKPKINDKNTLNITYRYCDFWVYRYGGGYSHDRRKKYP